MPDIDPAALSRQDSISQPSTSLVINKSNAAPAPPAPKAQKAPNTVQRIELEPLYTSLKGAIGDQWGKYKEATSLFILGKIALCYLETPSTEKTTANSILRVLTRSTQPERAFCPNRPFLCRRPFDRANT